jgi:large subunit ribosomal protein L6
MVKFFKQRLSLSPKIKIFFKKNLFILRGSTEIFLVLPVQLVSQFASNTLVLNTLDNPETFKNILGTFYSHLKQNFKLLYQEVVKVLVLRGVGYRAEIKQNFLLVKVGFSKTKELPIPSGLKVSCPTRTTIRVMGFDRNLVENFIFKIKNLRKPEPYKGKGILSRGQKVSLKTVKK